MKKIVIMTLAFALSLSAGEANKENKSALLDFSPKQTQGVCVAGVDLEVNRKGCSLDTREFVAVMAIE